jgi:hypothetical protein
MAIERCDPRWIPLSPEPCDATAPPIPSSVTIAAPIDIPSATTRAVDLHGRGGASTGNARRDAQPPDGCGNEPGIT